MALCKAVEIPRAKSYLRIRIREHERANARQVCLLRQRGERPQRSPTDQRDDARRDPVSCIARRSTATSKGRGVSRTSAGRGAARNSVRFCNAFAIALSLVVSATFAPISGAAEAADELRKVSVVSFGLFGDQRVFQREATGAAQIVANRFGADPVIVRFNTKKGGDATTASLAATLQATAKNMDAANDVLFLILTSHGSQDGLAVVAGRRRETLTPARLADMLNATSVRYRVVVISACYSGVFIPRLANADSLVITAADADHASFGCEDRAKWTYFGDAFFNVALRRETRLKDAFVLARSVVAQREARNGFEPSHPQMAGGENVEPLLVARP
jgi:peptidase C13-like protein